MKASEREHDRRMRLAKSMTTEQWAIEARAEMVRVNQLMAAERAMIERAVMAAKEAEGE